MNVIINNCASHVYQTSNHDFEAEALKQYGYICDINNFNTICAKIFPANLNDKTNGNHDRYDVERVDRSNKILYILMYITY